MPDYSSDYTSDYDRGNLGADVPGVIVSKYDISFVDAGLTSANLRIIYLVDNPLKSYVPGRVINGISGFQANKGYYIVPAEDIDLSLWTAPPVE